MLSHEQFIEKATLNNKKVDVIGQYINSSTPILVRCKKCGNQFYASSTSILQGHGCAKCFGGIKLNHSVFIQKLSEVNKTITVLGDYKGRDQKIEVRCEICGYTWAPTAGSLLQGHGCPKCVGKARLNHDEFVGKLKGINSDIDVIGQFLGVNKPLLVKCKKCGYEWKAIPKNLLNGTKCIVCANKIKKTQESFEKELYNISPEISVIGKYENANKNIEVQCKMCGHKWKSKPHNLLRGYGCPICVLAGTSRVERFILECFIEILGEENVLSRDKQCIGAELDIFIPSKRFAIEYGSWHWHKDKIANDISKRELCREKGIRLITIYDLFKGKELPFSVDCYVFKKSLSINSMETLCGLVDSLFQDAGFNNNCGIDYNKVKETIIKTSGVNKHKEFVNIVSAVNPNIQIIGTYIGANNSIKVKCKECGYIWEANPSNLKSGSNCPKCARKIKKTNEQFQTELSEKFENVVPLEEYINAKTKIEFECKKCGYRWKSAPHNVLRGCGCPRCSKKQNN